MLLRVVFGLVQTIDTIDRRLVAVTRWFFSFCIASAIVNVNWRTAFIDSAVGQDIGYKQRMKPNAFPEAAASSRGNAKTLGVPGWLKWAYTAFMLVLVPVYWANYGPTNLVLARLTRGRLAWQPS